MKYSLGIMRVTSKSSIAEIYLSIWDDSI